MVMVRFSKMLFIDKLSNFLLVRRHTIRHLAVIMNSFRFHNFAKTLVHSLTDAVIANILGIVLFFLPIANMLVIPESWVC